MGCGQIDWFIYIIIYLYIYIYILYCYMSKIWTFYFVGSPEIGFFCFMDIGFAILFYV
jgi:hypothetical protein